MDPSSRVEAGAWRFDVTAKPASTPALLAARLGAALSKARAARGPAGRDGAAGPPTAAPLP